MLTGEVVGEGRARVTATERALCVRLRGSVMERRMPDRPCAAFFSEVDTFGHDGEAQQYLKAMAARATEMRRQGYALMGVAA
jgi:hypothetical protein